MRRLRPAVGARAVAFLAIVSVTPGTARAQGPSKQQCIAANEEADALRRAGRLQSAKKQLLVCVAQGCPGPVRADCAERLNELERAQPTIVFTAKGPDGDLTNVRIVVDGVILAERLDGSALTVDPGEHTFELSTPGQASVTKRLLLTEGARGRQETITFGAPADPAAQGRATEKAGRIVVLAPAPATVSVDGAVVGSGRYEGKLSPGPHDIRVTEPGKTPFTTTVSLREDESRTVTPMLEGERSILPYIIGGAVVVVAGAAVGGYFLFKPADRTDPPPTGRLGSVTLPVWRP